MVADDTRGNKVVAGITVVIAGITVVIADECLFFFYSIRYLDKLLYGINQTRKKTSRLRPVQPW
jgi:hypothetical protein